MQSETDSRPPAEPGLVRLEGLPPLIHPLGGCGYRQFWRHFVQNWPYDLRSLHARLFSMLGVTLRLSAMTRERWLHGKAIEAQEIESGPVFLVGHWRSGTTYLHNLLSQDPRFAHITFSESAMPLDFLSRFRPAHVLMDKLMPKTRGMDDVAIAADTPQEEEMALGALGDVCFYKCFYFPRQWERHFRRAVLLEDLGPGERERLGEAYRFLARKLTYAREGRTVLFKNPASTARLSFLKESFPRARFVHIVRNPYEVFPSMMKLWERLLNAFSWQSPAGIDFEEVTFSVYERTMRAHLADRERISAEDLHEVRYEDLDRDPLGVVEGIHRALGMEPDAGPARAFLEANAGYRKNAHILEEGLRARIAERLGFAFERWGYRK